MARTHLVAIRLELLATATGLPVETWREAHDTAADPDLFNHVVDIHGDTSIDPRTIATILHAFRQCEDQPILPQLADLARIQPWPDRRRAALAAADLAKERLSKYATLARGALAEGIQETGTQAGAAAILGVGRSAVSNAMGGMSVAEALAAAETGINPIRDIAPGATTTTLHDTTEGNDQ